ncbi:MAG TPA: ThiF family adenylyltransferase [Terriglobia bacterium]|nr:ThiF family adenylyltransferase [Terriglobia bacterium]
MSKLLIDRSPDLKKLQDEGFDIEIIDGFLLVRNIPYLNSKREIKLGILVADLQTTGTGTAPPGDHVVRFAGEAPCDASGAVLSKVVIETKTQAINPYLTVHYRLSSRPADGSTYKDFYDKMTAYVAILLSHAHAIDPTVTAQPHATVRATEDESVFEYLDTASSKYEITMASKRLEQPKVAIVGVGGTGSYVLDLVAKTPVKEIHLFDEDPFYSHNAFRAPSAASADELDAKPTKVAYFKNLYSKMRRGIFPHEYHLLASNVAELQEMNFVFLCIDASDAKKVIVEALEGFGIPFIDVGMGIELVDDSLNGMLRVTTSTPQHRDHLRARVPLAKVQAEDDYDRNIQVADLNALNAALAVIKWKKLCGFYFDFEKEHNSTYTIEANALINDDQ